MIDGGDLTGVVEDNVALIRAFNSFVSSCMICNVLLSHKARICYANLLVNRYLFLIVLAITNAHLNPQPLKAASQDGTTGTTVL